MLIVKSGDLSSFITNTPRVYEKCRCSLRKSILLKAFGEHLL